MPRNNIASAMLLWRETAKSRGRLLLATDGELLGFLQCVSGSDAGLAARAAAELALRAWLGKRSDPWPGIRLPEAILPEAAAESIRLWLSRRIQNPHERLSPPEIPTGSHPSALANHLRHAVMRWNQADGFVLLVARHLAGASRPAATAAPFHLEVRHSRDAPPVIAENAQHPDHRVISRLVPAWWDAWNAALRCGFVHEGQGLMAVFPGLGENEAHIPQGRSAAAPFFLALGLRHLRLHPPAWAWTASGYLDSKSLRVDAPQPGDPEWTAKSTLAESFGIRESLRLLPDSWPSAEPRDWKTLLKKRFGEFAEDVDFEETEDELERIDRAMHSGIPNFNDIIATLDRTINSIRQTKNKQIPPRRQRIKSRAILLKADALCHAGRPAEALRLVEERQGLGGYQSCRALLRNAVACVDQARFPEAVAALDQALEKCADLDPVEQTRIRRDALGTRGQALMANALESGRRAPPEDALANLRDALELTRTLDEDRSADQSEESRNLCYILLCHALFDPASSETGQLFLQSMASANRCQANPAFILRAAHLARYRALLTGIDPDLPWWPADDVPLPESSADWIAATALKYRAAVLAAQGNPDDAAKHFDKALRLLENAPALLGFIRATILLQAAESMMAADPARAREHLSEAHAAFAEHARAQTLNPESPAAPSRWLEYTRNLEENKSRIPSPQLLFQY